MANGNVYAMVTDRIIAELEKFRCLYSELVTGFKK